MLKLVSVLEFFLILFTILKKGIRLKEKTTELESLIKSLQKLHHHCTHNTTMEIHFYTSQSINY